MRILAVDTSTPTCGVAIFSDEKQAVEIGFFLRRTHTKHLAPMVEAACNIAGIGLDEMDGFAAACGPGSFTGLRIGMSTVLGFSQATGRPAVGVSSLDALAAQAFRHPGGVRALIDAKRGEVYFANYQLRENRLEKQGREQIGPPETAARIEAPCLFIGSGAALYAAVIQKQAGALGQFADSYENTIRASTVGQIAIQRLKGYDGKSPGAFLPAYIRKSDAQINREAKKISR